MSALSVSCRIAWTGATLGSTAEWKYGILTKWCHARFMQKQEKCMGSCAFRLVGNVELALYEEMFHRIF